MIVDTDTAALQQQLATLRRQVVNLEQQLASQSLLQEQLAQQQIVIEASIEASPFLISRVCIAS